MTPLLANLPVYIIFHSWLLFTPLKIYYLMFIWNMTWEKYVHLQSNNIQQYFLIQFVQCIIELVVLKKNISCWSHIFLGLIHRFFQCNITTISFLKYLSMDYMNGCKNTLMWYNFPTYLTLYSSKSMVHL